MVISLYFQPLTITSLRFVVLDPITFSLSFLLSLSNIPHIHQELTLQFPLYFNLCHLSGRLNVQVNYILNTEMYYIK